MNDAMGCHFTKIGRPAKVAAGNRTARNFLFDRAVFTTAHKNKTALEAGRQPGIGYAKTCGNSPADIRGEKYRERSRGGKSCGCA